MAVVVQRVDVANWIIIVIIVEAVAGTCVQCSTGSCQTRQGQRTAFHWPRPRLHRPRDTLVYPANGPERMRL